MWKLHRKLNFPNIFRLAAIYTWTPAFNFIISKEAVRPNTDNEVVKQFVICFFAIEPCHEWIWSFEDVRN